MQARLYEFLQNKKDSTLNIILCEDATEAEILADCAKLCGYYPIVFPDFRAEFGEDLRSYSNEIRELMGALKTYYQSKEQKQIIISPIKTVRYSVPAKKYFDQIVLEFAQSINIVSFKEQLLHWGYVFVDTIDLPGEVSFRGDIIDIFSYDSDLPIRVSLYDNEIESIRYFDSSSQKSYKDELPLIAISPAPFALQEEEYEDLNILIKNSSCDVLSKDIHSLGYWFLIDRVELLKKHEPFFASNYNDTERLDFKTLPEPKRFKSCIITDPSSAVELNKSRKITLIARDEGLVQRSGIDLKDVIFIKASYRVNLISQDELIFSLNPKLKQTIRRKKRGALDLGEIKVGDYVVHDTYGVGIFDGLEAVTILGATKEFAKIRYQNDDKLLVPVENLECIDKYVGAAGELPILDKLGNASFAKLKASVKDRLFEIAKDIIDIAAKRELISGTKIDKDRPELKVFANSAGFEYTYDQEKAIEDILKDMASGRVMDRLLSGDVGFGKTEVAMNAILAAYLSGHSSVLVAPTAILANQHFTTLQKRLAPFGLNIARIDRFVSTKEKNQTALLAGEGKIDVLVGTHAIFGINMKNLALAILDEEHKFGVKQKEKLKNLKADIHALSMSATPIPRTLNLALSKIKGISELLTPPKKRLDVKTFVKVFSDTLFKEAALRELRRGGQMFYVHNRIATIVDTKKSLQEILPNLSVEILHSQVTPDDTEKILLDFQNKKFDCLISTNIIESGIDMPNVNTIFIDNADMFGVADLHQLRGRVGRSDKQGYCYFFVEDFDTLTYEAKKRLSALESNSYLGSGATLAYHDLELRGGGNIIGEAQSGHIKHIGYSLYLRMLEDAINTLSGEISKNEQTIELKLSVSAYLSDRLIPYEKPRLELYRRLSLLDNISEISQIEAEIIDRFGTLDEVTKQFLKLIEIKILSLRAGVKSISNFGANITIVKTDDTKLFLISPFTDDDDILDTVLKFLRK